MGKAVLYRGVAVTDFSSDKTPLSLRNPVKFGEPIGGAFFLVVRDNELKIRASAEEYALRRMREAGQKQSLVVRVEIDRSNFSFLSGKIKAIDTVNDWKEAKPITTFDELINPTGPLEVAIKAEAMNPENLKKFKIEVGKWNGEGFTYEVFVFQGGIEGAHAFSPEGR